MIPEADTADAGYESQAYQEILPLRTRHIDASTITVRGGPDGYDPARTAARLRAAVP